MTSSCPPQTDAYRDLFRIFGNRNGRVLEFEILPPAFGPFLEDDCSIGLTKKYLVQAFVVARKLFFDGTKDSNYNECSLSPSSTGNNVTRDQLDETLAIASQIILLFDCEHLTACNWRKQRLAALAKSDQEKFIQALEIELSLMATYLCSPLHRHTKSPTLWQHREWIQTHLIRLQSPGFQAAEELFTTELSVALCAGERHPRNYYAFSYMRKIHRILSGASERETGDGSARLGRSIVSSMLDWCLAHPADISGLMFLLYLLDVVPDLELRSNVMSKVVGFALDIGWEGESLWTFVDLAVRNFGLVGTLEKPQGCPWDVLYDSYSIDPPKNARHESGPAWKTWLDRAQVHWAHTRQGTIHPSPLT
ncbi:hypothetical protein BJX64DRAFT_205990 [Aspergillus heterothallicus]